MNLNKIIGDYFRNGQEELDLVPANPSRATKQMSLVKKLEQKIEESNQVSSKIRSIQMEVDRKMNESEEIREITRQVDENDAQIEKLLLANEMLTESRRSYKKEITEKVAPELQELIRKVNEIELSKHSIITDAYHELHTNPDKTSGGLSKLVQDLQSIPMNHTSTSSTTTRCNTLSPQVAGILNVANKPSK